MKLLSQRRAQIVSLKGRTWNGTEFLLLVFDFHLRLSRVSFQNNSIPSADNLMFFFFKLGNYTRPSSLCDLSTPCPVHAFSELLFSIAKVDAFNDEV